MIRAPARHDWNGVVALADELGLPSHARAALLSALSSAPARILCDAEDVVGVVSFHRVPLAPAGHEITWLLVRRDARAVERAKRLIDAVRDALASERAAMVRFVGGSMHRGGADAHILEAAGLERRGRIPAFYGPDDDLLLYAGELSSRTPAQLDPTSPAALQDAAFAYRDFAAERDFLLACARAHGGRPVRRVASWACGSGRHVHAFAELGIDGVGVDEDEDLLSFASRASTASATWITAALDASVEAEPVDLSFTMLSAVHRLVTEPAIVAHLHAAARLLSPNGVHVIEATHPHDLHLSRAQTTAWTELREGYAIHSKFRLEVRHRAEDGTVPAILDVRCTELESGKVVASLQQQERWLVPDVDAWMRIVDRSAVFDVAAALGDFRLDVPWNQPGAWRTVLVLRRRA